MRHNQLDRQLTSIAVLSDPVRRELYFLIVGLAREVSRDEAARAVKISRPLAAFHLDKLVDAGLLETSFRRLGDRRGPGAGRPSKLYRRSDRQIDVSLPARRYDLAGQLMASALAEAKSEPTVERLLNVAQEWGHRLGSEARPRSSTNHRGRALKLVMEVLRDTGFEPRIENSMVVLQNCPFEALARENRELVCGMNRALVEGVVQGLGIPDVQAKLDPGPGRCCVTLLSETDR